MSHSEVPPPPGIWSLPAWTGRNLASRESLLVELRAALAKRGVAPLCGLGGAGKSKLAVEYAHRNAAAYDTVFMIRAGGAPAMDADFQLLASELQLDTGSGRAAPGSAPTPSEPDAANAARAVSAVKSWLGRRDRWLLIFDDVSDPREIEAYLPGVSHGGHVIMTSRNPIWRGLTTVSIRGIDRAEAVRFLLQRTGETDAEAADALAEELGDLALALAQAGAYIEETGRPLAEYLALFRQRAAELLGRPASLPVTVATAWGSSLTAVFRIQPARELLSLCSFLKQDEIPRRMLHSYDPLALDDAIAALRLHSLVEVRHSAIRVHRLVKVVVRNQLHRDDRRRWKEVAHRILQDSMKLSPNVPDNHEAGTLPDLE